ncbi:purine biosynthesis protein PurH [Clostridium oryzae]|uniref:Purine biosynthesis protein PurH n=1 Tax=Clostridium oryzae TaxID=1450648 RepID=A0A1V4IZE2_9CLOT|nr:purine biosynthesis protein PurH [Clostridium oryzae]OPJ64787.1 hypothetical protein CLORY_02960 [Clostridium oryzae]
MDKFLIKNTTKEQREQIVKESLGYSDIGCDDCGASYGYDMYQPYIDGEKELSEISKAFHASYVSEHLDDMNRGCGYIGK